MISTKEIIQKQKNNYSSIEVNKIKNYSSIDTIETIEADNIIKSTEDLIDDESYKPFFYKRLYAIGKSKYLEIADHCRKHGKVPAKLFVYMLKKV